jgi:hypothetical protein
VLLLGLGLTEVAIASPAGAATASGCSGFATSAKPNGGALDEVSAPGDGGTEADPFTVDPEGPVSWEGSSEGVIKNGTWKVSTSFFSPSGSFDNDDGKSTSEGTKKISDYVLPFLVLPGLYEVDVNVTGEGGTCTGHGFIEVESGAAAGFWTAIALLLLLLAIILLMLGRPELADEFFDAAARPTNPDAQGRVADELSPFGDEGGAP